MLGSKIRTDDTYKGRGVVKILSRPDKLSSKLPRHPNIPPRVFPGTVPRASITLSHCVRARVMRRGVLSPPPAIRGRCFACVNPTVDIRPNRRRGIRHNLLSSKNYEPTGLGPPPLRNHIICVHKGVSFIGGIRSVF